MTTAVRFLTTVSTSVHHHLFAAPEVLDNVCRKIISPNVQLLQADEDEPNPNPNPNPDPNPERTPAP